MTDTLKSLAYPLESTPQGRLQTIQDDEVIWQHIEHVLDTPQGSAALDPRFGVLPMLFETEADMHRVAYSLGRALAYACPYLEEVGIEVHGADYLTQTFSMTLSWSISSESRPRSRHYPYYKVPAS